MATMNHANGQTGIIMIGGGELGRCPTRIHHDRYNTTEQAPNPVMEHRIAEGRRWEDTVVARLLHGTEPTVAAESGNRIEPDAPVVIAREVHIRDREAITLEAMHSGVPLILGGRLSVESLQSVGAPDILVRLDDGYAPIDVKHHKAIGQSGIPVRATSLDQLGDTGGAVRMFRSNRVNDLLQVAHYWKLLDHRGFANPRHLGGIIGAETSMVVVWVDLATGRPPILERHREALDEAIIVAAAGRLQPDEPIVAAVWRGECRSCPWAAFCRAELEALDHVSLLPAITADDTERLLRAGITTTAAIATLEPGSVHGGYEVAEEATLQARALATGSLLRRSGADLHLPDAGTEIDFDIETYLGTLYLAGLLIHESDGAAFRPISDWSGTAEGERRVLRDLFQFFDDIAERRDAVVYHWTGYERTILNEAALRHGLSLRSAPSVDAWFDEHACDLWSWTKERFVSPNGYSLKVIAPLCGFQWRDSDPGGAQSELWYIDAVSGDDEQRLRLLEYNEDDVAAQAAIRRWVRAQT
jgi:predicted RecB family nuclease